MWYNSLSEHLKKQYGKKVYKLALDAGCTCPNRDGAIGTRGCIFCSADGSGDFAASRKLSIKKQLADAKAKIAPKLSQKEKAYIAYFQAFTNTYGDPKELEQKFLEAVSDEEVVLLSIATRPDCLGDEVMDMLARLQKIKPVWVELGLQTIYEHTAKYIRRGYALEVYDQAVRKLKALGITVITHVIIGLPHETREEIIRTVKYVGDSGADGIKLQLLHVLKGTDLAADYKRGAFDTLTMEQYIDILEACVRTLPPKIVIHRLTGDGSKRILIAPKWSGNKRMVMNTIQSEFAKRNVIQGSMYEEDRGIQ